jgi:tRNA-dihydrouridine synthase 3
VRAAAAVATRCGVTFKTRTAYHKQAIAHTVLPHAGEWGADAVTLHGRTREQRYQKLADWDYIERVAGEMPRGVQMIGNGDVYTFEDYEAHMASGKARHLSRLALPCMCSAALFHQQLASESFVNVQMVTDFPSKI